MKRVVLLLAIIGLWGVPSQAALAPRIVWSWRATSANLYAPPVVTDVHPNKGNEVLISDSEVRRLRCLDATGAPLWEFDGKWTRRLSSTAAVSFTARPNEATVAICGSDGKLWCIDGATGAPLWSKYVGKVEWGVSLWTDLSGDGKDELVVGSFSDGVVALDADGNELWRCRDLGDGFPIVLNGPIAAADVDRDGKNEVFGASSFTVFSLSHEGRVSWKYTGTESFLTGVSICDADYDMKADLFCVSSADNHAYRFDARSGSLTWKQPLLDTPEIYSASSFALGDLDGDGRQEMVVSGRQGIVQCLTSDGNIAWTYETQGQVHGGITIADVDGDWEMDVLVASGDHNLYCLSSQGSCKWQFETGLRLLFPPTVCDVNGDMKTNILLCGSDHMVRCLTTGGKYNAANMAWPSRRFDAASTGSSYMNEACRPRPLIDEQKELLPYGGFEHPKVTQSQNEYPNPHLFEQRKQEARGWNLSGDADITWSRSQGIHCEGQSALEIGPRQKNAELWCDPIRIETSVSMIDAEIRINGSLGSTAHLVWYGSGGLLAQTSLELASDGSTNDWRLLRAHLKAPPPGAVWLVLQCNIQSEQQPVYLDSAHITARCKKPGRVEVLVNQVGYDVGAPKHFTVQTNLSAESASFEILNERDDCVYSGELRPMGRIKGYYNTDWGYNYWNGDFSDFDSDGLYRIRVLLGGATDISWPFDLRRDVLWSMTSRPAYRFFYYQRCGMAIPGFHGPCHLDDATSEDRTQQFALAGGWHDAGDYNKYHNAPHLRLLTTAYSIQEKRYAEQDLDANGVDDFLDELLWGGDHVMRMLAPDGSCYGAITSGYEFWGPPEIETDNIPSTGDERTIRGSTTGNDSSEHTAALAAIARLLKKHATGHEDLLSKYVEASTRGMDWALNRGQNSLLQFGAALDLYEATEEQRYADLAKGLTPAPSLESAFYLLRYDEIFGADHTSALREVLVSTAEDYIARADNPFGVITFGDREKPNFFNTPPDVTGWHVGTSSDLMRAANVAALAFQFKPDPRFRVFVYDQFNWLLGTNPVGLSLMEGAGDAFLPTYHQRLTAAGVERGAVPGSVVNGITWIAPGEDRPYLDLSGNDVPAFEPNEVWLPHNTAYLHALSNLQRMSESSKHD